MFETKSESVKKSFWLDRLSHSKHLSFLYILLVALSVFLPLIFWHLKLIDAAPFVSFTRFEGIPFELFSGLITFSLAFITWIEIKKIENKKLENILPVIVGLLVGLSAIFYIAESTFASRINSDYIAFEKGAKAILVGVSPYIHQDSPYVYPPLVGKVMSSLYQFIVSIPIFFSEDKEQGWEIVFYLFQCCQLFLVISAYCLTYIFSQKLGLKPVPGSLIVAALFVFNVSVERTLVFHQTNLWILNCFLIGFLYQKTRPLLSGFAVALGIHVKMYPFILMLPWIALRKWRLLVGVGSGLFLIALPQTKLGRDWTLLSYFFEYLGDVSKPTPYRNNSINSVVYNFFKIPNVLFGTSFDSAKPIVTIITLGFGIWFLFRFLTREKLYGRLAQASNLDTPNAPDEVFRLCGHSMDAIALGLLISPSVYEHHYIVAIPVALWAIATRGIHQPSLVGISIFLLFCIPTFDLFPLSFHQLLGLIMLVYITAPSQVYIHFSGSMKKTAYLSEGETS